jgi:orotidine-5'-phosphate decarboxylase
MHDIANNEPRVIVALDYAQAASALAFVERVSPSDCRLKVGKELFTRSGPDLVRRLVGDGFDVFLDLKYHDIPNTVARACEAAADLGVWMLNVHAGGGLAMMEAASQALHRAGEEAPLLIAVTVLTSMDDTALNQVGVPVSAEKQVLRLARLAGHAGLDGVVCSPREVAPLRAELGKDFLLVTPGVRPAGAALDDQSRVMTPREAVMAGASYLVIGRPITKADDPTAVLRAINVELAGL